MVPELVPLDRGETARLQKRDRSGDYELDPSCDKEEPRENLKAQTAAFCCLMRWQRQEKSYYGGADAGVCSSSGAKSSVFALTGTELLI